MEHNNMETLYKVMFPDYPDVVSVAQLQEMLGISRHLAYDLINDEMIKAVRIGNSFKVPKIYVINYVIGNCEKSKNIQPGESTCI